MKRLTLSIYFILLTILLSNAGDLFNLEIKFNLFPEIKHCENYLKAHNYEKAIYYGELAVKIYPRVFEPYFCLGRAYLGVSEFEKAIDILKKAENRAWTKRQLSFVYSNLGHAYGELDDFDTALFYHQKSLEIVKELEDKRGEAAVLSNIARIYEKKGDLKKALEYYEESLRINPDEKAKAETLNSIALVYSKEGQYDKAIEYLKQAIEIDRSYENYHWEGRHLLNLGDVYTQKGDYKRAALYLDEGLKKVIRAGDKYWEARAYEYYGKLYLEQKIYSLAEDYYKRAQKLFAEIGANDDALRIAQRLQELEKRK